MSEIELRECPFCGSEHLDQIEIVDFTHMEAVLCTHCDAQGPAGEIATIAAVLWNTRPRQSELEGIIGELITIAEIGLGGLPDYHFEGATDTLTRARKKLGDQTNEL